MAYQYADYPGRSQQLVTAGERVILSLQDEDIDRSLAIKEIEFAVHAGAVSDQIMGFSAKPGDTGLRPQASTEDALSGLLLDLQSANVLISAGIAMNEHGGGSAPALLKQSLQEVGQSRSAVTQELNARAQRNFAPAASVKSPNPDAAKAAFRQNAEGVLKDIVDEAESVISTLVKELKKLDPARILEAINKLGESVQFVASAGRLIQLGIEKLKSALEALTRMFGKDLLGSMKKTVGDIWEKFHSGKYTKDFLAWTFDVKHTEALIASALAGNDTEVAALDNATNDLPALADKYKGTIKLLRAVASAVVVAGSIIAFLHLAAPWVPLALAGIFVALIAATVLVGRDYCDSGSVLQWVRGLGQIAGGIKPTPAKT